jgi:cell division protease FtsH
MREKDYSESTAVMIDEEVRRIVDECYKKAYALLKKNEDQLRKISTRLLEKEVLDAEEIKGLIGMNGSPSAPKTAETAGSQPLWPPPA